MILLVRAKPSVTKIAAAGSRDALPASPAQDRLAPRFTEGR